MEAEASPKPSASGPIVPEGVKQLSIKVEGHELKFTNLDKVLFPRDGVTKRDLINFYDAVADLILPHLKDRPLSLKRYPNGIDQEFFFQKNIEAHYPDWLRIEPIHSEHRGEAINYVVCNDRATLLYLANLACIDQNPWMSRIGSLDNPDYHPDRPGSGGVPVRQAGQGGAAGAGRLDQLGLEGYPKTTGGDGMHVYIPIEPRYTYEQARSFAEILSRLVLYDDPDLFTTPRSVQKRRKGRVYFDWMQLAESKTIAAPYVVRAARPRAGSDAAALAGSEARGWSPSISISRTP